MMRIRADLHVHTALSPCAAEEMTPPEIVRAALESGLEMVAICDHNAAGNTAAVMLAAGERLCVVAGIEITTREEVHVLGLFGDSVRAQAVAARVGADLPAVSEGYERRFGAQTLMDAAGSVVGREERMLASASGLALEEAVALIKAHAGVAVAAHVNRPSFSVTSQLGTIPTDVGFDALEVFTPAGAKAEDYREYGLPVLTSSDSHYPGDVGSVYTALDVEEATFDELVLAVGGREGRRVCDA
jgi:predicted metal-dependent phosphoesterase TrpH